MNCSSESENRNEPRFELIVKASDLDGNRAGACLFCQEFWMELYALDEIKLINLQVKVCNSNSQEFKKNYNSPPPILIDLQSNTTYTDSCEIESRIFQFAENESVTLFEKDSHAAKHVEPLFRNFKMFIQSHGQQETDTSLNRSENSSKNPLKSQLGMSPYEKLLSNLSSIDTVRLVKILLREGGHRYLLGSSMTEYDCELMPRLHHIRIAGGSIADFLIPSRLTHLWNYLLTAYRTAAFVDTLPADQDIIHHYRKQLNNTDGVKGMSLEVPTKTISIPSDALEEIKRLGLLPE